MTSMIPEYVHGVPRVIIKITEATPGDLPYGTLMPFLGTDAPEGWINMEPGAPVPDEYPRLQKIYGECFPDFRGHISMGVDDKCLD